MLLKSVLLQYPYYGGGYGGGSDIEDMFGSILPVISIVIGLIIFWVVYRKLSKRMKTSSKTSATTGMIPPSMGLRGKTTEQKQVIKYFMSTGILGMIFKISDKTFDTLLDNKASEVASRIVNRSLEAHGMDADEVQEIPPILTENYYGGSQYFKLFRDETFRASGWQMTYLMFSEKQMYAYSYIFDLTSAETIEQTKEYFYEDITSIDIIQEQKEFPAPRPMEYLMMGVAGIIIGFLMMMAGGQLGAGMAFIGFLILIASVIVLAFLGFSRKLVNYLTLRLTVPGDEFVCSMHPDNIAAIQGMKAKIREKKI